MAVEPAEVLLGCGDESAPCVESEFDAAAPDVVVEPEPADGVLDDVLEFDSADDVPDDDAVPLWAAPADPEVGDAFDDAVPDVLPESGPVVLPLEPELPWVEPLEPDDVLEFDPADDVPDDDAVPLWAVPADPEAGGELDVGVPDVLPEPDPVVLPLEPELPWVEPFEPDEVEEPDAVPVPVGVALPAGAIEAGLYKPVSTASAGDEPVGAADVVDEELPELVELELPDDEDDPDGPDDVEDELLVGVEDWYVFGYDLLALPPPTIETDMRITPR